MNNMFIVLIGVGILLQALFKFLSALQLFQFFTRKHIAPVFTQLPSVSAFARCCDTSSAATCLLDARDSILKDIKGQFVSSMIDNFEICLDNAVDSSNDYFVLFNMQLCYDQIKYFSKSKNKTTKFNSEKMVLIVFSIFMISLIFLTFKKWNSLSNTSFSYFFERFKSFISYFTSAAKEKSISRGFFTAPNALKQNEMHSETENNEVMELHEEIADFLNDSFENLENGNNDDDNDSKSADECELPIILSENTAPFSSSVSASTNNSSNSSKKSDNFDLSTVEGIEKWKNFIKHKVKLRIQDGVIGSDTGKSDNPVLEDSQSPLSPKESFNSGSSQLIYPPIHLPLRWITPAQLQHKTNMENIQFYDKNGKKFRRIFLPERGWISSRKLEQEIRSGESATFGPLYGMATNSI